jgi:hypothetical protein
MAAFNDALDLKVAVGDHIGNRNISDVWARLVQQAEVTLNQRLRTGYQITDGTLTFTDGRSPLPSGFMEMLHTYGLVGYQMHSGPLSDFLRPGSMWSRYEIQGDQITIRGFSGDKQVQYYAKIPTISTSLSATNWLLENYPNAYLYAVALEAAKFLRDAELAAATDQLLNAELQAIKIDDDRSRWSNASVRVQGCTP